MTEKRVKNISLIMAVLLFVAVIFACFLVITPTWCDTTYPTISCYYITVAGSSKTFSQNNTYSSDSSGRSEYYNNSYLYLVTSFGASSGTTLASAPNYYSSSDSTNYSYSYKYTFTDTQIGTHVYFTAKRHYYAYNPYGGSANSTTHIYYSYYYDYLVLPTPTVSSLTVSDYITKPFELTYSFNYSNLVYQWYCKKNGETTFLLIDGATQPTYSGVVEQSAQYYCRVSSGSNYIQSATFSVTALESSISVESVPRVVEVAQNGTVSFECSSTVSEGLTASYQWYMNDEILDGETNSFIDCDTSKNGEYEYYCVVSDGIITAQSNTYYLTVKAGESSSVGGSELLDSEEKLNELDKNNEMLLAIIGGFGIVVFIYIIKPKKRGKYGKK